MLDLSEIEKIKGASTQGDLFFRNWLEEIRAEWQSTIAKEGGVCCVCDRWGKIYGRNINKTMAVSLLWLAQAPHDDGWVDVPNKAPRWVIRSNQLPTLKWWGLVERRPNDADSTNKHSGMWRVTPAGKAFALEGLSVPKRAFTYNDEVLGFGDDLVKIKDCFKTYFDYQEVMNLYFPGVEDGQGRGVEGADRGSGAREAGS